MDSCHGSTHFLKCSFGCWLFRKSYIKKIGNNRKSILGLKFLDLWHEQIVIEIQVSSSGSISALLKKISWHIPLDVTILIHPVNRKEKKVKRNEVKKDLTSISSIIRKLELFRRMISLSPFRRYFQCCCVRPRFAPISLPTRPTEQGSFSSAKKKNP